MTMTVTSTTLCFCRHILNSHPDGEACATTGCRCTRFSPASRSGPSHYRRGQRTETRRVIRLQPEDVILVGYPGRVEYVRGPDGDLIWEQRAGELTSRPVVKHIQDMVLRPVRHKTGALLATVTGRDIEQWSDQTSQHLLHTSLGDLPVLSGATCVLVLS